MIDSKISYKINILSFISIVLVLYIHSYNLSFGKGIVMGESSIQQLNVFIQNFISSVLSRMAIPIFFIISGFLLFKKFSYDVYYQIIKKRFLTLVIPYLFWSTLTVIIFYVLESFDATKAFFTRTLISDLDYYELFNIIVLEPKNYPLWFLRDLIILIIVSPLIYYVLKRYQNTYFAILAILWLFFYPQVNIGLSVYKPDVVLFFSIGGSIALFNQEILSWKISHSLFFLLSLIYSLLLVFITLLVIYEYKAFFTELLLKISIIMGILVLWFLLDYIKLKKVYFMTSFTFIIYVCHEPMLTIYKKALIFLMGNNASDMLFIYLIVPLLVMVTVITLALLMKRYFLSISKVLLGNRI